MSLKIYADGLSAWDNDYGRNAYGAAGYRDMPVDGITGYFILGSKFDNPGKNFVRGANDASRVGNPAGSDAFQSVQGLVNYFQTDIAETAAFTHLVVWRTTNVATGTGRASAGGTFSGPAQADGSRTSNGVSIFNTGATTARGAANYYNSSTSTITTNTVDITVPNLTDWGCYINAGDDTTHEFGDYLRNIIGTPFTAAAGAVRDPNTNTMRIGGVYVTYSGISDIAASVFVNRKLSEDEKIALRDLVLADLAALGLVLTPA